MTYDPGGHGGEEAFDLERPEGLSNIPVLGGLLDWISGEGGRRDARNAAGLEERNRRMALSLTAPTADQLTPQYGHEGLDAQRAALSQMQEWGRGGLTDTDRGMMEATRRRDEQGARSQASAIQQQSQARGMGGSGMDLASQQQASQLGQQQSSDRETSMLASAQARALQAMQQSGQLGGQIRQQGQHEAEAVPDATQGAWDAATQRAALVTGQYAGDQARREREGQRRDQQASSLASAVGGLLD